MKKIQLIMLLFLAAVIIQSCKKDATTSASTTSDKILSANINGTAWNPDTVSASITYNSATKAKVFAVEGIALQQRITINITVPNSTNTSDFPLATFKVDTVTNNAKFAFFTQATANDPFIQRGTVSAGDGTLTVTAVDADKKVITGTYSFTSRNVNRDQNGNIISVDVSQVLSGTFTNLPFTFASN